MRKIERNCVVQSREDKTGEADNSLKKTSEAAMEGYSDFHLHGRSNK